MLLDEQADDAELRETIFSSIPKSRLAESVSKVNELARPQNNNFHDEMVEQYGRVKRFLPAVLRDLHFQAAPAGEHTLAAIHYLTELNGSKKRILDDAPEHIITGPWKRLVYDAEGRIQRAGYSLCLLERLQDALRRRDIWLENSDRWGNPREKLLQGEAWQAQRVPVCRALGYPTDGHKGVQQLAVQLDETWKAVASRFEGNAEVHICNDGKYPSLTISSLEKLEEPPSLHRLNGRVRQLLPPVDLTELLLEIDARTGFTREFTHVSESGARAQDLHVSLCAVLMAEACNIGLEPLIKHNIPALTRHRLSWVKQNYLRAETLVSANARLVDFQSTLELAGRWGGGEVASADGMRFVTPVKSVNSGPNRKYFGSGRGITWYNFVSDQYSGFHGIVARITEALTLTPEDVQLDGPRPCVRLRTLKQRQRGRGRPSADERIARIVPLLDASYVEQLKRYLATFRPGRRRPLFDVSRKTTWLWLQQAEKRAGDEGIQFTLPALNPKTFRHSFAMHLFFNHFPPKVVQAYMGHERYESTGVYLKVFALDVAPQMGVTFSMDHREYAHLLTVK